jgi:GAF domain-containing protein
LVQPTSAIDRASLADEQAALRRVATLVAQGVQPLEIFSAVSEEVGWVFGSQYAGVARFELDGSGVVILGVGKGIRNIPIGTRWPLEDFLATTTVYRTGRPARNERSDWEDTSGPVADRLRELGLVSTVAAPIVVEGNVWGVITVSDAHQHLPPDTEERLAAFTELVATAIANAESRAELATSEARARELAEEQAALRRVATLVAEGTPPTDVLDAVAVEVGRLIGADLAVLSRYNQGGGVTVLSSRPDGTDRELPFTDLPTIDPESLTAVVLRTGRPARIDDYAEASGPWAAQARELGYRSGVGAPVTVQGRLWGVMIVTSADAHHWPSDTEDRLAAFTELLATAIANTESRGELAASEARAHELAEEQAALRRVATLVAREPASEAFFSAVAREVASVLNVPGALVERFEADGASVSIGAAYDSDLSGAERFLGVGARTSPDPGSLTAQVFETRHPARVDDFSTLPGAVGNAARAAGVGSGCAGPIVVNGDLWGMLAVFSRARTVLPVGTENRLHDFIELVATAIANYEARADLAASEARARELANEQAALRRVATLVAQGASSDELFSAVAREVAGVIDIPVVGVHRYEADGTVTTLGVAGETSFTVGTRLRVTDGGIAAMMLSTGLPARIDDYASVPRDAVREDLRLPMVGVPIVVEGRIWGFMVAADSSRPLPADTEERLARFTELVATAVANSQARERVAQLADEQAALRRVAALVAEGASSTAVFDAVAQEVAQLVQFTPSLVARYEDDGETLTVLAICGARPASFAPGSRHPLDGPTVAAEVLRTGGPVRLEDYTDLPGTLAAEAREHGWTRTAGAPIIVDGRVWGLVAASGPPDERLPENLEDRLSEFTQLVATAIANSQAHEELAQLADEQVALRRVATLVAEGATPNRVFDAVRHEVARMFNIPSTILMRFDADGMATLLATYGDYLGPVGTRWPLEGDTSAVARVHQTGRAARADYTNNRNVHGPLAEAARRGGVRYPVAVPVVVEGALWGAMSAGSYGPEPPPADLEGRLAKFTELLGTAIANAENRADLEASEARARELANEQAALRRVATLVAQGASPDELFCAVAKEVAGVIDVPVVGINRYEADGSYTIVGNAGESSLWIGTRWPVADEGLTGMILATGRPSRQDDFIGISGNLGDSARDAPIRSWQESRSVVGVPIIVEGSIWGIMSAAAAPGTLVPAGTEERLARFTELIATAVSNATTRTDLLTSRARLVSAADESRRRLERDLHDGIQQWLVALALRARKAAGLSAAGESAVQELSGLADDLVAVTDELREISRGIHPAILSDAGLDDALEALARRSTIRIDLDVSFQGRYDPTLEATVYYVAAESITNAVKHAQASTVTVRGGRRDGSIELEITDDGVGGADPRHGTGLIGLKDRVDTLGGTISFASPAAGGTTIRVKLPAGPRDTEDLPLPRSDEAASAPTSG